jgi:hypothetical protein
MLAFPHLHTTTHNSNVRTHHARWEALPLEWALEGHARRCHQRSRARGAGPREALTASALAQQYRAQAARCARCRVALRGSEPESGSRVAADGKGADTAVPVVLHRRDASDPSAPYLDAASGLHNFDLLCRACHLTRRVLDADDLAAQLERRRNRLQQEVDLLEQVVDARCRVAVGIGRTGVHRCQADVAALL